MNATTRAVAAACAVFVAIGIVWTIAAALSS